MRGIFDRMSANSTWAASRPLNNAGAELWRIKGGTPVGRLHHKLAVIDEQVISAGSFNYTGPANAINDENILVIGDLTETDAEKIAIQRRLASYALTEIQRIRESFGERM